MKSVAYATDDSASEDGTARPVRRERRSWCARCDGIGLPSSSRLSEKTESSATPYFPAIQSALTYSRVMRAIFEIGISFGHTASHSPSFEQLPNPSASACSIIATTRLRRSSCPCGSSARWEIFELMNRCAEAFLQAATQAPHAMQAAESIAASDTSFEIGIALPSGAPPQLTDT